ncbi:MAG: fibronectin type III domain-containing protein [Acidimicrobiales bacterium]
MRGRALASAVALVLALGAGATPASGAPLTLTATSNHGTVFLRWNAVGGPTLGYAIERSTNGRTFVEVRNVVATSTTFSGLRAGIAYSFVVDAIDRGATTNRIRVEATSNVVVVTPIGAPAPPVSVLASARVRGALVTFRAPHATGGLPVLFYRAVASPSGRSCRLVSTRANLGADPSGPPLSCALRGLADGVHYRVRVTDTTRYATSRPSAWSNVVIPGQRPVAPGGVTAVPLDQSATVSWSAAYGGGAPITGYVATAEPGAETCATHASGHQPAADSCVISGLTDALTYTVTVVASSPIGSSAPSSVVTVVPSPVANATIGPFATGSAALSGVLTTSVSGLAQAIALGGDTYVALQGFANDVTGARSATLADARAVAVATALRADLTSDGVTTVTVRVLAGGTTTVLADATSVVVAAS